MDAEALPDTPAAHSVYDDYYLSDGQIRLLLLEPASDFEAPIECNLEVIKLCNQSEYEALSYTWGSPTTEVTLQDQYIELCGTPTKITGNLCDALRYLRFATRRRHLWVDALSINQADLAERSGQVAIMARIYQLASKVEVWLGVDYGDAKVAMAYYHTFYDCYEALDDITSLGEIRSDSANIEKWQNVLLSPETKLGRLIRSERPFSEIQSAMTEPWNSSAEYLRKIELRTPEMAFTSQRVFAFLKRRYFSRRWVLQELHNASEAELRCGHETTSWSTMRCALEISMRLVSNDNGYLSRREAPALTFNVHECEEQTGMKQLLSFFDDLNSSQCEDPRDRIYALLGLCTDAPLLPNYSLSVEQTWIQVAKAAIEEGLAVYVIECAAWQMWEPNRVKSLPSWVPDFGQGLLELPNALPQLVEVFVDIDDRLICTVQCIGEVTMCNGYPLLSHEVTPGIIDLLMAEWPGPTVFTEYSEVPSKVPQVLYALVQVEAGDLVCSDSFRTHQFVLRRMGVENHSIADHLQDWQLIGSIFAHNERVTWPVGSPYKVRIV